MGRVLESLTFILLLNPIINIYLLKKMRTVKYLL